MCRAAWLALVAAAVVVLLAPAAGGHALVRTSDPANGAILQRSPPQVMITFTEPPDPGLSFVHVLSSSGQDVTAGAGGPVQGKPLELRVRLKPLPQGVYTVTWRTVSKVDGHVTGNSFSFGVGVSPAGAAALTGASAPTTPSPSALAVAGRWAFDWGLLLLLGSAVAVLFVFREAPPGSRTLLGGAWLLAAAGLVAMILSERSSVGIGLRALLQSGAGQEYVRRGVGLLVAGAAVTVALARPVRASFGAVGAVAAGTMLVHSMAGHAGATQSLTWFNVGDQWVHLLSVGVWVGGLGWLLLGLRGTSGAERLAAVRRFSWLAGASLAVVAVTGVVRALDDIGGPADWSRLLHTSFGQTLLVKAALFVALVALGARNRYVNVPKMAGEPSRLSSLRRTVVAEVLIAVGVLGATGLLSELPPAATLAAVSATPAVSRSVVVAGSDFGTTVRVRLTVTPGTVGPNTFEARVTDYDTGRRVDATRVSLRFSLPGRPEVGTPSLLLRRASGGDWTGRGTVLSMDGRWEVSVLVEGPSGSVTVPLSLQTRLPPESIKVAPGGPGQPTLYTIAVPSGGSLQTYVDPAKPGVTNQVHFTFFTASGGELPLATATATATSPSGVTSSLKLIRFDSGHFVANVGLTAGGWRFSIDATARDGRAVTGHFGQRIGS